VKPLLDFLTSARGAGVTISTAESIVAVQAAALVGYQDRSALKDALGLVLANTPSERAAFDACFERYFGVDTSGRPVLLTDASRQRLYLSIEEYPPPAPPADHCWVGLRQAGKGSPVHVSPETLGWIDDIFLTQ